MYTYTAYAHKYAATRKPTPHLRVDGEVVASDGFGHVVLGDRRPACLILSVCVCDATQTSEHVAAVGVRVESSL